MMRSTRKPLPPLLDVLRRGRLLRRPAGLLPRLPVLLLALVLLGACVRRGGVERARTSTVHCDLIIAGGTTAATAAAISASQESLRLSGGRWRVCLLEPTDWPGGQLTASGVAAIDFDHHRKDADGIHLTTRERNNATTFAGWISRIAPARQGIWRMQDNPGRCWVSVRCYEPSTMLALIRSTLATYEARGVLRVFPNTVPSSISRAGRRIQVLQAIRRHPRDAAERSGLYTFRLSQRIRDWYSPRPSPSYAKELINFRGTGTEPVFIDATEWGELLALSHAAYAQGTQGATHLQESAQAGQAFVYPIALELVARPTPEPAGLPPTPARSRYTLSDLGGSWEKLWRYRRMKVASQPLRWPWSRETARGGGASQSPRVGDVTQINSQGNDYLSRYLFLPRSEATRQVNLGVWTGGVDITALAEAEAHSLGFFRFLRRGHPNVVLSRAYGTTHGLTRVPYMRDSRRSIGYQNYMLHYRQLSGDVPNPETSSHEELEAIAIGFYEVDIHGTDQSHFHEPLDPIPRPFSIPFSSLTNRDLDNFLVAGKTIAQTPWANAATRLHPIEFNIGTGAGVAAMVMRQYRLSAYTIFQSARALQRPCPRPLLPHSPAICVIRARILAYAPLEVTNSHARHSRWPMHGPFR